MAGIRPRLRLSPRAERLWLLTRGGAGQGPGGRQQEADARAHLAADALAPAGLPRLAAHRR